MSLTRSGAWSLLLLSALACQAPQSAGPGGKAAPAFATLRLTFDS